jgi:hypothetical protein
VHILCFFKRVAACRQIIWCVLQLLLGYLPPDPSEWDEVLARKRTQYLLFCEVGMLFRTFCTGHREHTHSMQRQHTVPAVL